MANPVRNYVRYGQTLVESGVSGLRNGSEKHLNGQNLSSVLGRSARSSAGLVLLGVGAGVLQIYLGARRNRLQRAFAAGATGAAVAFLVGFTWKSRQLTASMVKGAAREIGIARNEHWLERNPIDYA